MTSYSSQIIADGALAYYRMDQSSGTSLTDSSGHSYTGTISGTVTYAQTGALGSDSDTSMKFDGSTAYVTLPGGVSLSTACTLECWVKASTTVSGYPRLIANDAPQNNNKGIELLLAPPADGVFGYCNFGYTSSGTPGHNGTDFGTASPTVGTWYYVVVTYDGAHLNCYINGQQATASEAQSGGNLAGGFAFDLAKSPVVGGNFAGYLDEVAIYASALTGSQIQNHYTLGVAQQATASETTKTTETAQAVQATAPTETTTTVSETLKAIPVLLGTPSETNTTTESAQLRQSATPTETWQPIEAAKIVQAIAISEKAYTWSQTSAQLVPISDNSDPNAQMLFADLQLEYTVLRLSAAYKNIQRMALVYYVPKQIVSEYSIPGYIAVLLPGQDWSQHTRLTTINQVNAFITAHS